MVIESLKTDFVKLYSKGIEIKYLGNAIEYDDKFCTFVYFYYTSHRRVYIINGVKKKVLLPQINDKINIICKYEDKYTNRFNLFLKYTDEYIIYSLPPIFFRKLKIIIEAKKMDINDALFLYKYYKKGITHGINYINE